MFIWSTVSYASTYMNDTAITGESLYQMKCSYNNTLYVTAEYMKHDYGDT